MTPQQVGIVSPKKTLREGPRDGLGLFKRLRRSDNHEIRRSFAVCLNRLENENLHFVKIAGFPHCAKRLENRHPVLDIIINHGTVTVPDAKPDRRIPLSYKI